MMAGATLCASAAAVKLPRVTTETKDSISLNLSINESFRKGLIAVIMRIKVTNNTTFA